MTRYAVRWVLFGALFFVSFAAAAQPAAAARKQLPHLVTLRFGEHRYTGSKTQSVLGAEYDYKFSPALSLGLAGDYLSGDFFGTETDFRTFRVSGGPNLHVGVGCLPINIIPGVGLTHWTVQGEGLPAPNAVGLYGRVQGLLKLYREVQLGLTFRREWNRLESDGTEFTAEIRVAFRLPDDDEEGERRTGNH